MDNFMHKFFMISLLAFSTLDFTSSHDPLETYSICVGGIAKSFKFTDIFGNYPSMTVQKSMTKETCIKNAISYLKRSDMDRDDDEETKLEDKFSSMYYFSLVQCLDSSEIDIPEKFCSESEEKFSEESDFALSFSKSDCVDTLSIFSKSDEHTSTDTSTCLINAYYYFTLVDFEERDESQDTSINYRYMYMKHIIKKVKANDTFLDPLDFCSKKSGLEKFSDEDDDDDDDDE